MFTENAYADDDTIAIKETVEVVPTAPESSMQSVLTSMVPMVLIFIVFYFFLIRPQEKRRKEKESVVSSVKKGEEVVTNSGIFGIVSKINDADNTIDLEISENIRIKVLKSAILDITSRNKKEAIAVNKSKKDKGK
ncbi:MULTISPECIES: preprotein translocase subunit YajC [unclassified Candidatus Tisiphia]|uniref:preprotein translocase subunit YajC n=1 Tax=unclassified Candidatus Tisiphia TaxID=2996318 RepID=UPI001D362E94|nr:preprotein translocase subunit YajC [Rickettsia endosymbiont of Sericostoma sp. HW-2014]